MVVVTGARLVVVSGAAEVVVGLSLEEAGGSLEDGEASIVVEGSAGGEEVVSDDGDSSLDEVVGSAGEEEVEIVGVGACELDSSTGPCSELELVGAESVRNETRNVSVMFPR